MSRINSSQPAHANPMTFVPSRFRLMLLAALLVLSSRVVVLRAQSSAKGEILIKEDFSGGSLRADPKMWSGATSWDVPETWEKREGVIACVFDLKAHPGKGHGRSLDPRFKAHDLRVSYRIRFDAEEAKMAMLINATFRPTGPGGVLWHIGDVVTRVSAPGSRDDVSIAERDFTRDVQHPALKGRKLDPKVLKLPEGTYKSAYGIPGGFAFKKHGLVTGRWYQFVVESVGVDWTLWVDGREVLSLPLKRTDVEKESVNFIGFGPLLMDDIIIEAIPSRSSGKATTPVRGVSR